MSFGLSSDGFYIKRLQDIKTDLENAVKAIWPKANVDPESVFGQLIGVFSKPGADIWEQTEKVYLSQWPSSADGVSLDYVLEYNGLTRLDATETTVQVGLKGTVATVIQIGKQVRSSSDNEVYRFDLGAIIDKDNQPEMYIVIDTVTDSIDYTITIDATPYTINSGVGATKTNIANALVTAITDDVGAVVTATKLASDDIRLERKTGNFDTDVTAEMSWYNVGIVKAINKGKIFAPQNTLTIIETPVSGWDDVNNFISGVEGRSTELDAEARIRRENSLQVVGAGTLPSIVARMQDDVEDVTQVKGFENRTDVTDGDERPPHSIEIVVEGGSDADIGEKLWEVKASGIQTYSSSTDYYDVLDSNGDLQRMFFTRPISVDFWVKADLTLYDEEAYPGDGDDQVKAKIIEYGNTFTIGLDVMPDRFVGPIMEVPGIGQVTVFIKKVLIGVWLQIPITVDASEIAVFDLSRIEINIL